MTQQLTLTLKMTTAQLVETSVTANNNGPIQYYAQLGDHAQGTYKFILFDMKLCFCHSQAIFSISIKNYSKQGRATSIINRMNSVTTMQTQPI